MLGQRVGHENVGERVCVRPVVDLSNGYQAKKFSLFAGDSR